MARAQRRSSARPAEILWPASGRVYAARVLVAVLAEVHANLAALDATLQAVREVGPRRTIVVGDLVPEGPDLEAVTQRLVSGAAIEWIRDPAPGAVLASGREHQLAFAGAALPESPAPEVGRRAMVVTGPVAPSIREENGWLVVAPGQVGGAQHGDPRSSFALVMLDVEPRARAWTERVAFDLTTTFDAGERAVAEGRATEPAIERYLRSFLGKDVAHLEPLHRADRGSDALIKLMMPRVRDVYRRASERHVESAVEHVHQVRVGTRRLRTALEIARPLMDARAARRARQNLRRLGSTLGRARAADVLLEHLDAIATESSAEEAVVGRMKRLAEVRLRRARAAIELRYPRHAMIREGVELVSALMQPAKDAASLLTVMRRELEQRTRQVRSHLPCLAHPEDDEGHHLLRIALKRLRYACEIVEAPFPELGAAIAAGRLRTLQDALGALHDRAELLALVERPRVMRRAPAAGIASLTERLRAQHEAQRHAALPTTEAEARAVLDGLAEELAVRRRGA